MTDLLSWLRSAIDEHERIARLTDAGVPWTASKPRSGPEVLIGEEVAWLREVDYAVWVCEDEQDGCPEIARGYIAEARHIALNDPAHVLRTVRAHREIVELHGRAHECSQFVGDDVDTCTWVLEDEACSTLRSLAAIYRESHPGFDPSWIGES